MKNLEESLEPNLQRFGVDPFGYASLGRMRWELITELAGYQSNIEKPASNEELKNPILWLTHADAMGKAATILVQSEPEFDTFPEYLHGVCDGQFRAISLMLVGYSLEICLKAMLIIKKGIPEYTAQEKKFYHHNLVKLADFIPNLSEKENAILELLTLFTYWAGRYPDPGFGKESKTEDIFSISEKYEISAKDLFQLAAKVMGHAHQVAEEELGEDAKS